MEDIILSYLSLHKKCYVPGLGTFTVEKQASVVLNNQLTAPVATLHFVEGRTTPDQQFLLFVAKRLFSNEVAAIQKLHDFAEKIRRNADAGITIAGVGRFTTSENQLVCMPVAFGGEALDIAIVHQEEEPLSSDEALPATPQVRDYWFVYALALIIAGLAAIYYYYS